jgi:putative hydroxymethylpyrimidine transport system substrate-binding protein
VHRVNIGFNAVAALAGGKVDAATAFWNAEGVQLQQMDVPIREFRVDEFGAPRYPELVIVTRSDQADELPALALESALSRGYELLGKDPERALDDLAEEVPGLDKEAQTAQLEALTAADAFARGGETATPRLDPESVAQWRAWATKAGLLQGG